MSGDSRLHRIPFHQDPLAFLADLILSRHGDSLPDLGALTVVLPSRGAGQRFRRILLAQASELGFSALIPPANETLHSLVRRYQDLSQDVLSETGRELQLVQALADLPSLREQYGTWPLIDSLLPLFDELALNEVGFSDSEQEFTQSLTRAYGASEQVQEPLGQEARLVFRLWQGWQESLAEAGLRDRPTTYLQSLARSLTRLPEQGHLYLAGILRFARAELDWLDALFRTGRADLIVQSGDPTVPLSTASILDAIWSRFPAPQPGPSPSTTAYGGFLDRALGTTDPALAERARIQAQECPDSPVHERLALCALADMEYEARAIDLQVRHWQLQGIDNIGIVTNDRKLARRVRALLERAQIELSDAAGWTLSTTSAAAALIQWLDVIEQDYHHRTLFSFLRSPHHNLVADADAGPLLHYLQKQWVGRARTFRGLQNYRRVLLRREIGANEEEQTHIRAGLALLDRLEDAQRKIAPLAQGHENLGADACFDALFEGLDHLGMTMRLRTDLAGEAVLTEIEDLSRALASGRVRLDWEEFRAWLHRQLERARYRPPQAGAGIELMGFGESRLYRFDALIIAGAIRDHLPGRFSDSPFFNESVRRQLGLESLFLQRYELLHDFRRLLEAAPRVLVTYARQNQGEEKEVSPWLERLRAFHRAAYGSDLAANELEAMAFDPATQLQRDHGPMPQPQKQTVAILPPDLIPHDYSSSTYQSLVDCPYQFFVRYGLSLRAEELPQEDLSRSDYGTRVHRILEAFHGGHAGLPGPFPEPVRSDNLPQARELLDEISRRVLLVDGERNPMNRSWYYRWRDTIPNYLAWLEERQTQWQIERTELELKRTDVIDGLSLHGRVDRLDRGPGGLGIVDYKTGTGVRMANVRSGEAVQLPFYARLLSSHPARAEALVLKPGEVRSGPVLQADELQTLADEQTERLRYLQQQLRQGAPLPAWGDENSCRYCELQGLCRKGLREEETRALSEI